MDFYQICAEWPTARELAEDLHISVRTVEAWRYNNRVPPRYWNAMLLAAEKRHLNVTINDFVEAAVDAYE